MTYHFNSAFQVGKQLPEFEEAIVKYEPMFWRASGEFAYANGGPITKAFLDAIGDHRDVLIDTRSHMLMNGWYPCIPGFHHDDVPRTRSDGQPNYDTPEYRSKHVMAMINGGVCPTEFAVGQCVMSDVPLGGTIYKVWHREIEQQLADGVLTRFKVPSNKLIWFDWQSFHQGTRAIKTGWRWFGRATFDTTIKPENEIRKQVQVYLEFPMEGW